MRRLQVPEQAVEPRARIAYVLGQFPSVSETFILREIRALQTLGFNITILSMQPGAELIHNSARPLLQHTRYRPSSMSWASVSALFRAVLHKPFGYLSALGMALSHAIREPGAIRELISAFAAACYFVVTVRPGQMRHIHAHFATYPSTVGLLLAEMLGVGFSMSCHARDIFTDEARVMRAKLAGAEFISVCTNYGADRLQRQHAMLNSGKLKVIRHGIDFTEFVPGSHRDYRVPLILSVGRLIEKKGFPILLRAAAIIASEGIDFELAIIGEGPQREELEQLINGLALTTKVHLPGEQSEDEMMAVYRMADLFALTPIVAEDGDRDGLPNVIIEAMAADIPVVATNVGAIGELVVHEETGLLAQPGNVQQIAQYIEHALVDRQLRSRLVANARYSVERHYDITRNAGQLGSIFAELLKLRQWPPIPGEGSRMTTH
jgi:glycosyltransferase involved in cell wall biosynthesis